MAAILTVRPSPELKALNCIFTAKSKRQKTEALKGDEGTTDLISCTFLYKPLGGVLCVCLFPHLWDSFESSWAGVRRTEYSTTIPA